jgi:DeoR family suf operon transcriptional repressor
MDAISPGLAAHRGLRGEILVALKKAQPVTAKELGEQFSVSANAVRRHLKELEAEGLVAYGREQRGTGAPTYCYRLSPNGEALFPNQYEEALTRVLEYVMQKDGRGGALSVFEQQYAELRRKLGTELDSLTPLDRVKAVAGVLEEAGFMPEPRESAGEISLHVQNCSIRAVANCLPEICEAELRFLEDVLAANIERRAHIVDGCNACEYAITFDAAADNVPGGLQ